MKKLRIFDPTTEPKEEAIAYGPRPESLRNLQIGLVDNTKHHSDKLLLKIALLLEKKHGAGGHIIRKKRSSGSPVPGEIINEYKANCAVVIAGIGD